VGSPHEEGFLQIVGVKGHHHLLGSLFPHLIGIFSYEQAFSPARPRPFLDFFCATDFPTGFLASSAPDSPISRNS
jgi:hypothetical protein